MKQKAYVVLSIADLKTMLRNAKKKQAVGMARHKAAGRSPDLACSVFRATLLPAETDGERQLSCTDFLLGPD